MTTQLPTRRMTEFIKPRSLQAAAKDALDCARLQTRLPASETSTMFARNRLLVSLKDFYAFGTFPSARAISASRTLERDQQTQGLSWYRFRETNYLWAFYKPPFVPLRQFDAEKLERKGNFHQVSVERFVERSQLIANGGLRSLNEDSAVNTLVVYDLSTEQSGVMLVMVNRATGMAASSLSHIARRQCEMNFELIVHGHQKRVVAQEFPVGLLYPHLQEGTNIWNLRKDPLQSDLRGLPASPVATYSVLRQGYYGSYAASLVAVKLSSPPSAVPATLRGFTSAVLSTHIVGDDHPETSVFARHNAATGRTEVPRDGTVADFPRVMNHLRKVSLFDYCTEGGGEGDDDAPRRRVLVAEYSCQPCLGLLVRQELDASTNSVRVNDGCWNPLR